MRQPSPTRACSSSAPLFGALEGTYLAVPDAFRDHYQRYPYPALFYSKIDHNDGVYDTDVSTAGLVHQ